MMVGAVGVEVMMVGEVGVVVLVLFLPMFYVFGCVCVLVSWFEFSSYVG
jgi:hypothetical protein